MHDLGLGGPVEVERDTEANHRGPCFDGVYGCHRCWDAENDGKGTVSTCEWCKAKDVHTRVIRAIDEPVMYAVCGKCQERHHEAVISEYQDYDDSPELDE